jgi:hypothetical protein
VTAEILKFVQPVINLFWKNISVGAIMLDTSETYVYLEVCYWGYPRKAFELRKIF